MRSARAYWCGPHCRRTHNLDQRAAEARKQLIDERFAHTGVHPTWRCSSPTHYRLPEAVQPLGPAAGGYAVCA